MRAELVVDCRDWHGEGIFWSAASRPRLLDRYLRRTSLHYEPANRQLQQLRVPGRVCAFTTRKGGPWNQVVAAFAEGFAFLDLVTGERKDIARGRRGQADGPHERRPHGPAGPLHSRRNGRPGDGEAYRLRFPPRF